MDRLAVLSLILFLCQVGASPQDIGWKITMDVAAKAAQEHRFTDAEASYQHALDLGRESSGSQPLNVAVTLNDLAAFYHRRGQYDKAEPLYREALAIREKNQGLDDPKLLSLVNNFGALNCAEAKYEDSQKLFDRAMEMGKKEFGLEHATVATSLQGLAAVAQGQSLEAKAESLYLETIAIREKVLDFDDPDLAYSYEGYASVLRKTKREGGAEELEARARAIRIWRSANVRLGLNELPPLHKAAFLGNTKRVNALLGAGADPESFDNQGNSALFYAAWMGHTAITKRLVNKANVNLQFSPGATPLYVAAR